MKREPFVHHEGRAVPLMIDNIDTDQIIPSREMKTVSRQGLAEGLFAGWRYLTPDGRDPDPNFALNQDRYRGASILIAGANFGCGSSREHAVWALAEYGVRAIVAKSFGEIFSGNCIRNGLLPIRLDANIVDAFGAHAASSGNGVMTINLADQTVAMQGQKVRFEINAYAKRLLLEGLDPIDLTLKDAGRIDAFAERDRLLRPWVYAFGR